MTLIALVLFIIIYLAATSGGFEFHNKDILHCDVRNAVYNFILQNNWNSIVFFAEKDLNYLFRGTSQLFVKSTFVPIQPQTNLSLALLESTATVYGHVRIVILAGIEQKDYLITAAQNVEALGKRFTWLFIEEPRRNFNGVSYLRHRKNFVTLASKVFSLAKYVDLLSQASDWHLMKLIHQSANSSIPIGILKMDGLNAERTANGTVNNLPLQALDLKIGFFHIPPYGVVDTRGPEPIYSGFIAELLKVLSKFLGFSYHIVLLPFAFGAFHNGSWTGIIGNVQRQELDVGAMPAALTVARSQVVEFSAPMVISEAFGVIRKDPITSHNYNLMLYVDPFSLQVWLVFGATCILFFSGMMFTVKIHSTYGISQVAKSKHSRIAAVLWTLLCVLLQTDERKLTQHRASRVIFLALVFFVILISKTYTSLLTAKLTLKKDPMQYESLDEVLDDGIFGFTLMPRLAIYSEIKNAKSGTFKRIWDKVRADSTSLVNSTTDGIKICQEKNYVHLTTATFAAPLIKNSNCTLETLKQSFRRVGLHMIFPKNSPLSEIVSLKILSMQSSGVLGKLQNNFVFVADDSSACKTKPFKTIPIQQAVGAFFVLCAGILAAVLTCIAENVLDSHLKRRPFN